MVLLHPLDLVVLAEVCLIVLLVTVGLTQVASKYLSGTNQISFHQLLISKALAWDDSTYTRFLERPFKFFD